MEEKIRLTAAPLFQKGMVLQCGKELSIWGTGVPDQIVTVSIQDRHARVTVSQEGCWQAKLPPLAASRGETLAMASCGETLIFSDIAVGEVWLAGGQSNMEFQMAFEKFREEEFALPANADLRFYDVPEVSYPGQDTDFDYSSVGIWRQASPEELKYFSAVGYYFQKHLAQALHVPVGIIGCNWGGTTASSWMRRETVEQLNNFWWQSFLENAKDLDWEEFYEKERKNPFNHRGDLLNDPYTCFIMPRTPRLREIRDFLEKHSAPDYLKLSPQTVPGSLYQHMVRAVAPYCIRGILWYQGESDDSAPDAALYQEMLTALIADWRALWGDELPFLVVQLPPWQSWILDSNKDYKTIRLCQQLVADRDPNVSLCSISDAGEQFDVHPKDKRVVGQRLALLALGHIYGQDILCDAPALRQAAREGSRLTLAFANADNGLTLRGDAVNSLHVTQEGDELPYTAEIQGCCLILHCAMAESPVTVSFAQDKWYQVNLYNEAGLPAIPFSATIHLTQEGQP